MFRDRVDILIRIIFGAFILVGCYMVLRPFLTAIMLSAVLTVVSWPYYVKARSSFAGHKTATASLMVTLMIVTVLIPIYILCAVLVQQIPLVVKFVTEWVNAGMPVPPWVSSIPIIGDRITDLLSRDIDVNALSSFAQGAVDPVSTWFLDFSLGLGNGLFQIALVAFISFFFYRDGEVLGEHIKRILDKVSGGLSAEFNSILLNTTRSVVFGVIGTAIGQGVVAGIGFVIVGAPCVVLLSFAVCILSVVPMGPPLIWIPIAVWLYATGSPGLAIFLVLWGVLAVASVDSFLKPILISRGSTLPLALVFLGVFGGIISFGLLGLVLGPVFLAASIAMFQAWLSCPKDKNIGPKKKTAMKTEPEA